MSTEVYGIQQPNTETSEYNTMVFVIAQQLAKLQTITLVKVVAVSTDGGVSPVGTVDVQPLVNQLTANRQPVPHGVIHGVPYFRIQGGQNAVILDPQVGDIGMAAFAARDISAVVSTKAAANPASFRRFDWADALYLGGFLGAAPTQYVQFDGTTLNIVSGVQVNLNAPSVKINGQEFSTHTHSGVQSGGSDTGPVVP